MKQKLPAALRPVWRVWISFDNNKRTQLKYKDLTRYEATLLAKRFKKAGLLSYVGRDWLK